MNKEIRIAWAILLLTEFLFEIHEVKDFK